MVSLGILRAFSLAGCCLIDGRHSLEEIGESGDESDLGLVE